MSKFPATASVMACLSALLMGLTGCETVDHSIGIGQANPRPSVTGRFDGSYYGEPDLVKSRPGAHCPPDNRLGVIEIGDKRLSFAYQPLVIFNPPIQADGHVHDKVGDATLDGQITGRDLHLVITTSNCETRYDFGLIGNKS